MLRCCIQRPRCLQPNRFPLPTTRILGTSKGYDVVNFASIAVKSGGPPLLQSRKIRNHAGRLVKLRRSGRSSIKIGIRDRVRAGVQWPRHHSERRSLLHHHTTNGSVYLRMVKTRRRRNVGIATGPPTLLAQYKLPKRTKYVSLGSWTQGRIWDRKAEGLKHSPPGTKFSFDASWSTRFASVARGGSSGMNTFNFSGTRRIDIVVRRYASRHLSAPFLYQAWMHLPIYVQPRLWQDVMLWCLKSSPVRAVSLLHATYRGSKFRPSRQVVGDCLEYLARHFHYVQSPDPWAIATIHHLTMKFMAGGTDEEHVRNISCQIIYLVIQHSDESKVLSLLQSLAANKVQIHANTLLHILHKAIEIGKLRLSMNILKTIADSGFNMSMEQVQRACVTILRAEFNVGNAYDIQTKLLTQMLEMGIRPNVTMYNAILLNTMEARDFDVAWQMYDMAKLNGLKPDPCTYGILLKGVRARPDLAGHERLLEDIGNDTAVLANLRLVGDLLNTISVRLQRLHEQPFPHLLRFYKHHFDTRPLQELGLYRPLGSPQNSTVENRWPTPIILGQMICAYIQNNEYSDELTTLYERYHELVHQNHPLISPLAEADYVVNAFILAFGRRSDTLPQCTTVIKHMLDGAAALSIPTTSHEGGSRGASKAANMSISSAVPKMPRVQGSSVPRYTAPTVRTWSILAAAYFRHGQKLAAEKVLALMRERNVKYDKVTWNTIISGYSGMQDIEKAVDAMKRMQADGFRTDSRTLKALSRSYNRTRLLDALEVSLRDAKSVEDLKVQRIKNEGDAMGEGWETVSQDRSQEVFRYLREWYKEHPNESGIENSESFGN